MSVALLGPVQKVAEQTPSIVVTLATFLGAIVAIWAIVVRFRKTRVAQWLKRRVFHPLHKALISDWRDEREQAKRAEANVRIVKVVEAALVPLATKIDEIAHSTNGKAQGEPTMSAEISALTATVGDIARGLALDRLNFEEQVTPRFLALEAASTTAASLLASLVSRVDALEGHHDPQPQAATTDQIPHRRHDD